jgi:Flp pilus assembly protein TadG
MKKPESRGQSILEFALTLPIFLAIVVGVVDVGHAVVARSLLANCARKGARSAIFPQTADPTVISAVNSQTLFLGTIPSSDISISPTTTSARVSGTTVTVTVTYQFHPITPLAREAMGSILTMTSNSTMAIE